MYHTSDYNKKYYEMDFGHKQTRLKVYSYSYDNFDKKGDFYAIELS